MYIYIIYYKSTYNTCGLSKKGTPIHIPWLHVGFMFFRNDDLPGESRSFALTW